MPQLINREHSPAKNKLVSGPLKSKIASKLQLRSRCTACRKDTLKCRCTSSPKSIGKGARSVQMIEIMCLSNRLQPICTSVLNRLSSIKKLTNAPWCKRIRTRKGLLRHLNKQMPHWTWFRSPSSLVRKEGKRGPFPSNLREQCSRISCRRIELETSRCHQSMFKWKPLNCVNQTASALIIKRYNLKIHLALSQLREIEKFKGVTK